MPESCLRQSDPANAARSLAEGQDVMRGMHWLSSGALSIAIALTVAGSPSAGAVMPGSVRAGQEVVPHRAPDRGALSAFNRPPVALELSDVACRNPSLCMAVGVTRLHPATEIWDGRSWHGLPTPVHAFGLSGVSCASRTRCVAVGRALRALPFALSWDGLRWRTMTVPSARASLAGISCPAPAHCMAVGNTLPRSGPTSALTEMWNGRTWSVLSMPAVPGAVSAELSAVSCSAATRCIAVGSYVSSSPGNPVLTLAEAWDGTSWQVTATPSPGSATGTLTGISCTSASSCIAVGSDSTVYPVAALIERWDGTSWNVLAAALPARARFSSLTGVSCSGAASCMAVGRYTAANGAGRVLTERWDGTAWRLVAAPGPFNGGNELARVSCPGADGCMAVGGGGIQGFATQDSLAEQWDGRSWQVRRSGQVDALAGVSCPAPARCMAAGGYISRSDRGVTLAEAWNGRRWRQRDTPTPAPFDALADISCVRWSFCMAVGDFAQLIAEKWDGRRWRQVTTPPGSTELASVSCASATRCMAVLGLAGAMTWNGRHWRAVPTATVPGSVESVLSDVSCPAATRCVAVGHYLASDPGLAHPLAEAWNGRRWRVLATPTPGLGVLTAVDCAGPSDCMAVGSAGSSNLAERWNGRTWQAQTPPGPAGLLDVSCPSDARCIAVGTYPSRFFEVGITERWNGRAWQQVKPAAHRVALISVSCARTARCIAVGRAATLTRAEQWNGTAWRLLSTTNP